MYAVLLLTMAAVEAVAGALQEDDDVLRQVAVHRGILCRRSASSCVSCIGRKTVARYLNVAYPAHH